MVCVVGVRRCATGTDETQGVPGTGLLWRTTGATATGIRERTTGLATIRPHRRATDAGVSRRTTGAAMIVIRTRSTRGAAVTGAWLGTTVAVDRRDRGAVLAAWLWGERRRRNPHTGPETRTTNTYRTTGRNGIPTTCGCRVDRCRQSGTRDIARIVDQTLQSRTIRAGDGCHGGRLGAAHI